jgi:putative peptide modification system cyclase
VNNHAIPLETLSAAAGSSALLRTLALADLADSTALAQRMGDQAAAELIRKHDRLARAIIHRHGGREIDKTDGFLILFERPIQAVAFAVEYQRNLLRLGVDQGQRLSARVGIHVGDVLVWENAPDDIAQGAKPVEVEGLVKPVAARLMSLARPGQILMSGVAQTLAQRGERELADVAERVRWQNHGRYHFKGVPEPMVVAEVGEVGIAPFKTPPSTEKAQREAPWWARPISIAVAFMAMLLAVGVPGYLYLNAEPALAFAERDWVLVGDLKNLTHSRLYDDSLETAFRVGLEQSRFVNVVSDLQVRNALSRMKLERQASIDRAVGCEIALREGARAVIIPTIAEVNGAVRVTAEVVDPATQATVYSAQAQGAGPNSVLESLDTVARQLRGQLGEALTSVQESSEPLAKVTTSNLDALRAYSLGVRAQSQGKFSEAISLYRQAAELDPEFALAMLGQARIYISSDDNASALPILQRARELRERLPSREGLYLDAMLATFGPPQPMLEKWSLMAAMYPDHFGAYANHALFTYQYTNRYEKALESVNKALSEFNPRQGSAHYLAGTLHLALEQYDQANAEFTLARKLDGQGLGLVPAEARAAVRDFAAADAELARFRPSGIASNDIGREITATTIALDRGNFAAAREEVRVAAERAVKIGPAYAVSFHLMDLAVNKALDPDFDVRDDPARVIDQAVAELDRGSSLDRYHRLFILRFAGYLAAIDGDLKVAKRAVAVRGELNATDYPNLNSIDAILKGAIAIAEERPEDAVKILRSRIDGTELMLVHVLLIDALRASDRPVEALAESDWVANRRGRAYGESGVLKMLRPLNVLATNIALLDGIELARELGDTKGAEDRARVVRRAWPALLPDEPLAKRVTSISAAAELEGH